MSSSNLPRTELEAQRPRRSLEEEEEPAKELESISLLHDSPAGALPEMASSRRLLNVLIPSFLNRRDSPPDPAGGGGSSAQKLAHLDGLRGIAALIVFFCHMGYSSHDLSYGYGYIGERSNFQDTYRSPFRLPIVRLFYDGDAAVCMFFIISGFALSYKPLRLVRAGDMAGFANTLASSTIRRGLRLFLPLAASTLCIALLVRCGIYDLTAGIANDGVLLTAFREPHPVRADHPHIFAELGHWAYVLFDVVQPWHWNKDPFTSYDIHLWTIPVEFRASLALFVTLLGVANVHVRWRRPLVAAIGAFSMLKDNYVMALFMTGLWSAETHLLAEAAGTTTTTLPSLAAPHERKASDPPFLAPITSNAPSSTPARRSTLPHHHRLLLALVYVATLFLLSQPFFGEDTLFWRTLVSFVPASFTETKRFYTTLGAIAFFQLAVRSPTLVRVLRSAPAQYLGRVSYALYLVHAGVLHTVGYAVFKAAWLVTGVGEEGVGLLRREVGFVAACCVITPCALWVADVFTRVVDEPCVRLARRVERRLCREV